MHWKFFTHSAKNHESIFQTVINAYICFLGAKFLYRDVLTAVAGYMKHFFGCSYCSKHFTQMAATMDSDVTSPKEVVLWLWRSHNKVNKRLHGDASEDPMHPKVLFPPKSACPKCYNTLGTQEAQFDEEAVLGYLLELYGADHIVSIPDGEEGIPDSIGERRDMDWWQKMQRSKDLEKLQQIRQQKQEEKRQKLLAKVPRLHSTKIILPAIGSVSQTDMSLCAVYYVMCVSIIIALYYHFFYKKKCKSRKHSNGIFIVK